MREAVSAAEARRLFLRAQGLLGTGDRGRGQGGRGTGSPLPRPPLVLAAPPLPDGARRTPPERWLRRLGAVQLDTISVLARSHELVAYARLGPIGRPAVEDACWGGQAFEYWAHAACVVPMEDWPWFAGRRARYAAHDGWHQATSDDAFRVARGRLAEGPATATELGGAKRGGPWWDWSEVKVAVERMLAWGEVVVTARQGWRRVYDLAERAVPEPLFTSRPSDEECDVELVRRAGAGLGVATVRDLAEYYRLRPERVEKALPESGLVPVEVEGWGQPAWADPAALGRPARGLHRTTLLSPFDSLLWSRERTRRMFGFDHLIEAYKPAPTREHGYFAMPLLAGGRLAGRADPKRSGSTLVARRVSVEPKAVGAMAQALTEAAEWVGCDTVAVEHVSPPELRAPLLAALG